MVNEMKLDLSEIAQHVGMHATQEIDEPCFANDEEIECVSPVKGKIDLTNAGTLLIIRGTVTTDVRVPCGRCLNDVVLPVETEIDEQFDLVPLGDSIFAVPEEEDKDFGLINNNVLDLGELIRQNLLVAIPISPLCTQECKGLCPTCGQNLNTEQCACPEEAPESPFQVLAGLLEDDEEESEEQ